MLVAGLGLQLRCGAAGVDQVLQKAADAFTGLDDGRCLHMGDGGQGPDAFGEVPVHVVRVGADHRGDQVGGPGGGGGEHYFGMRGAKASPAAASGRPAPILRSCEA